MKPSSQKSFRVASVPPMPNRARAAQSSGNASGQLGGQGVDLEVDLGARLKSDHLVNVRLLAARRANPVAQYTVFPDRWRALLHQEFLDAREVSGFFKVSEKAATKWWDGIGGPQGDKLDYALRELPRAYEFLYGQRAA